MSQRRTQEHSNRNPRSQSRSSSGSLFRPGSPHGGSGRNLIQDYTDRGRDLDGHYNYNSRARRNRPTFASHAGRYSWSSDESNGAYPPTRIPLDSFNQRHHWRRFMDFQGDLDEYQALYESLVTGGGYNDDRQLDYSWFERGYDVRRTDPDARRDFVREARNDESQRVQGRLESRDYYRRRNASDADCEDEESGPTDSYRSQRARVRSVSRSTRSMDQAARGETWSSV